MSSICQQGDSFGDDTWVDCTEPAEWAGVSSDGEIRSCTYHKEQGRNDPLSSDPMYWWPIGDQQEEARVRAQFAADEADWQAALVEADQRLQLTLDQRFIRKTNDDTPELWGV